MELKLEISPVLYSINTSPSKKTNQMSIEFEVEENVSDFKSSVKQISAIKSPVVLDISCLDTMSPVEQITAKKLLDRFSDEIQESAFVTKFIASPKKSYVESDFSIEQVWKEMELLKQKREEIDNAFNRCNAVLKSPT